MIDLCKLFGVEEGEEFKISDRTYRFKITNNKLFINYNDYDDIEENWMACDYRLNFFANADLKVIKLLKRKEFTDDELAIMRSLPKEFEWMARDNDNAIYIYGRKPEKECGGIWENKGKHKTLAIFNHIFQSIKWEDEEPVFIDDYVERGME